MTGAGGGETLWRIAVVVPAAARAAFEAALEPHGESLSAFEDPGGWYLEAISRAEPDRPAVHAGLARAAAGAGCAAPEAAIGLLAPVDWLAENRRGFPPIGAGRYFVHGSHFGGVAPSGHIAIRMDAGLAFGAGSHGSTRGCLLAIDRLAGRMAPARSLDLGCGSGILAIAMARTWGVAVLAADMDADAVAVARGNAACNGVDSLVRVVESEGFAAPEIGARAPFDMVCANILLGPLVALAPMLAHHLAPDGLAVLSGILAGQEGELLAAYRAEGLRPLERVVVEGWLTVVLGRGGEGAA